MAAADLGFPFTWAQWKELERQAMIYKYMTASIPVPRDLLLPIARSLSSTNPNSMGNANGYLKLGLPNNKEAEVGRCKRTDGKKWRCSRDVAPNQKYCERHLNRGRPRSRKPVEVLVAVQQPEPPTFDNINNKKSRFDNHNRLPNPENLHSSTTSSHGFLRSDAALHPNGIPLFLDHRPDEDLSVSSYKNLTRGLDWTGSELNLNPYTDFGATPYTDFSAPEPPEQVCLQSQNQMETGRGFIDAWSDKDTNKKPNNSSVVSSQSHLWPPSLTLSMAMAAGNVLDEEMGQIGMGLRVGDSEESEIHKARVSSWLSPVSYDVGSYAPGGPLAEMLRPSGMAACSDSNGVSSPSEVLQRTLLSLSDSSGCTSPSVAVPEMIMPFQWLN